VRAQALHLPESDGSSAREGSIGGGGDDGDDGQRRARPTPQFAIPAVGAVAGGRFAMLKSSAAKKVPIVSTVPTNLVVHATQVRQAEEERLVTTVTFGAPTAHSLGFKSGGLRETSKKLELYSKPRGLAATMGPALTNTQRVKQSVKTGLRQLELIFAYHARETIVLSQALAAAVAACIDHLTQCIVNRQNRVLSQVSSIGLLLHSVSLLSTSGKELAMIDDFAGAYERLNLTIRLQCSDTASSAGGAAEAEPQDFALLQVVEARPTVQMPPPEEHGRRKEGTANIGDVTVVLNVQRRADFEWVSGVAEGEGSVDIRVIPVLFNLGVNEMQSVSNAAGTTDVQTAVNRAGLAKLQLYFEAYAAFAAPRASGDASLAFAALSNTLLDLDHLRSLLGFLAELIELEDKEKGKHVGVLLEACRIGRLLHGARTTSCKSAKDRTSVFQTLEVARLARDWGWLAPTHEQGVLDGLRGRDGVRLRNCEANIERPKYSFNALQLRTLPPELRPPPATATGGMS